MSIRSANAVGWPAAVLVNNAGIALEWNVEPTNSDKIRRTLEVNLIAPVVITESLVPLLSLSQPNPLVVSVRMLGFGALVKLD